MYPVLFTIGPLQIYSYGVMLAIGFMVFFKMALLRCKSFNIKQESLSRLVLILLISGIFGARLLYVFLNAGFFLQSPLEIFFIHKGGLVFFGGLLSAVFFGVVYAKKSGIKIADAADLLAPFIALAHSIGRIGCFLNGCCFGKPTDSILGMQFPSSSVKILPVQLFSSAGLFVIFAVLFFIQKKRKFKGQVIASYLVMYGIFRFVVEFFRGDIDSLFYNLSFTQLVSVCLILIGISLYMFKRDE